MLAAGGTVLACVPTGGRGRQVVSTQAPVALPPQITVSAILGLDDGALLVATRATAGTGTSGGSEILELQTVRGDGGVEGVVQLRDPDELLPFVIVHELAQSRVMTAADLDIGAMQVADDGTLWLADRTGPFLIHCDASGRVLEPPVSLPEFGRPRALRGPDNPLNERRSALRLMNAVWEHAKAHGGRVAPIVSNHHLLLADDDATTVVSSRESPPGSLPRASSEVFDVESLQAAGFAVIPWTVNEPSRMRQLLRLGVDGIITDRPGTLKTVLARRGLWVG